MKKIPFLLSIVMLLVSLSCSFEPFQEVRVVGNPQIVIPLGGRSSLIGEQFDIQQELATQIEGQEGLSLLEAASPTDPLILEFRKDMVNMGVNNIPLDDLGLDSLNQTIDPTTMDIPDLNIPAQSSTAGLDSIPLPTVSVGNIDFPTLLETDVSEPIPVPTQTVSVTGFDTITYSAGNMIMTITSDATTPTFEISIDAVITTAGNTLTTTGPVTLTGTGTADLIFPLSGRSMGSSMAVDFTVTGVNGTLGQTFSLSMGTSFSGDAALSSANGIDFSTTQDGSIDIPFDLSDPTLKSLIIGSGSLVLDGPTMPGTWSGVTTSVDMDLLVNGASQAMGTGSLDLAGVEIKKGETVTLSYTVNVDGTGANVSVTPGVDEFSFTATPTITVFQEIELDATDMDFSVDQTSFELGPSITDLVYSVTFGNPGLAVNLDNQLPVDIEVTISSNALDLATPVRQTFLSGTTDSLSTPILSSTSGTLLTPAEGTIDINLDITMSGYNDVDKTLTLYNITPGTSYSLSGSVELYSDSPGTPLQLVEAVVKSVNVNKQFPADTDPGIDFFSTLSGLDDVLPGSDIVNFSGIEAFLDVDVSALTDNDPTARIRIHLSIDYTIGATTINGVDLLGTSVAPEELSGTQRVPFTDPDLFTTLINGRASDIYVHYDVTADGATVDLTGASQNIIVSAVAEIPIQLEFTSDYDLLDENDQPFIPTATEDLFGRDGSSNDDDMNEWLGMATGAAIHLELNNTLLQTTRTDGTLFTFTIADAGGTTGFSKTIPINGNGVDITLNSSEIATMTNPDAFFLPSYTLTLPAATYTVTSGDIDLVSSYISVQSDIDYTIDVGGAQ